MALQMIVRINSGDCGGCAPPHSSIGERLNEEHAEGGTLKEEHRRRNAEGGTLKNIGGTLKNIGDFTKL